MTTKVFITNKGGHDFSAAEQYGDFVFLSKGSINRYSVGRMYRQFAQGLTYSKENDYILLTSLCVMNIIACVIFALKFNRLNLLLFKNGGYVERTLDFSTLDEMEGDEDDET